MFTGIIESTGKIISLIKGKSLPAGQAGNLRIEVESLISDELKTGQSVSHNGVCLTVESKQKNQFIVTAVKETLSKTNLALLKTGSIINLERSLKVGDRLDGHFVQGHVDTTAICTGIKKEKGSWLFTFKVKNQKSKVKNLIITKGSICINGVSLTVVKVSDEEKGLRASPSQSLRQSKAGEAGLKGISFSVAIIPHTYRHTNFNMLKKGDWVNIEFDVLGKYIQNIIR